MNFHIHSDRSLRILHDLEKSWMKFNLRSSLLLDFNPLKYTFRANQFSNEYYCKYMELSARVKIKIVKLNTNSILEGED